MRDSNGVIVRGIPDPLGGTFDASGDFDDILDEEVSPVLASIDPNADTTLTQSDMAAVAREVEVLLARVPEAATKPGRAGTAWRGLTRFRAMVSLCQADGRSTLHFSGD